MTAEDSGRKHFERMLGPFGERRTRLTQVDLRVDPGWGQRRRRGLPFSLPVKPNTWTYSSGVQAVWLGPDEWLLLTVPDTRAAGTLVAEIDEVLGPAHHSAIDVSAARTVFEAWGDERRDLLSVGCGLDLHPRSWRAGMCAQTLLARIPVLLQEHEGMTRLFVRPSFAGYLVTWFQRSRPAT